MDININSYEDDFEQVSFETESDMLLLCDLEHRHTAGAHDHYHRVSHPHSTQHISCKSQHRLLQLQSDNNNNNNNKKKHLNSRSNIEYGLAYRLSVTDHSLCPQSLHLTYPFSGNQAPLILSPSINSFNRFLSGYFVYTPAGHIATMENKDVVWAAPKANSSTDMIGMESIEVGLIDLFQIGMKQRDDYYVLWSIQCIDSDRIIISSQEDPSLILQIEEKKAVNDDDSSEYSLALGSARSKELNVDLAAVIQWNIHRL